MVCQGIFFEMYQLFIFNESHNLKTKINRENNEQAISWDLDMLSA